MNLVFLDSKTLGEVPNISRLRDFGQLTQYATTTSDQIIERLRGQQIVITNKVPIIKNTLEQASDLQLICVAATGMNNIDREFAQAKGVVVKNVSGYSTASVAQHTWAMILTLLQRPAHFNHFVYSGAYAQHDIFTHFDPPSWEVAHKRLGIIGLGTIGEASSDYRTNIRAEVVYYSSSGHHDHPHYQRLTLDELLATSDIVSVHAPLNERTENLITYEQLQSMPDHALLINTGRGGIINEADLARAIDDAVIGGAGIDVFAQEPLPKDHPYVLVHRQERLLLTPHMAWASVESRTRLMDGVYQNIQEFVDGR